MTAPVIPTPPAASSHAVMIGFVTTGHLSS